MLNLIIYFTNLFDYTLTIYLFYLFIYLLLMLSPYSRASSYSHWSSPESIIVNVLGIVIAG